MVVKKAAQKAKKVVAEESERGSRISLIEDLFYDFNRNRNQVYQMNFIRGIFFGLGSVLGGTVVAALIVWMLTFFVDIPGVGESIEQVQNSIDSRGER